MWLLKLLFNKTFILSLYKSRRASHSFVSHFCDVKYYVSVNAFVEAQLASLTERLATAFELTSKRFFAGVDILVFFKILS